MSLRKTKVKESAIETELVRRIEALGGVAEKVTVLGRRGFFDRLVVLPGNNVWFVELKRPKGGRLSPHQRVRHKIYLGLQANIAIVRNMADIDRLIVRASLRKNLDRDGCNPIPVR